MTAYDQTGDLVFALFALWAGAGLILGAGLIAWLISLFGGSDDECT